MRALSPGVEANRDRHRHDNGLLLGERHLVRHIAGQRDERRESGKQRPPRGDAKSGTPAEPRVVTYNGETV